MPPLPNNATSKPTGPARLPRRAALLAIGAFALGGGLWWHRERTARNAIPTLTAPDAHSAAIRGALLLIDIRRPDEWALTGVPDQAHALDMRRPDFTAQLHRLAGANPSRPVALICARGIRSRRLAARLSGLGFPDIVDVAEGMLGSADGPGWVKRGLPVRAATAQEKATP
jgi:rhodanese-related sulfurtransferase